MVGCFEIYFLLILARCLENITICRIFVPFLQIFCGDVACRVPTFDRKKQAKKQAEKQAKKQAKKQAECSQKITKQ
jgi:hypothetical protein